MGRTILIVGAVALALVLLTVGCTTAYAAVRTRPRQAAWPWGMMHGGWWGSSAQGEVDSLEDAQDAVVEYLDRLGYDGLEVAEVMEFERNYYAIAVEEETGIGAMELLVDPGTGAVGPEPGPNMMWNTRYGMHRGGRGMMGDYRWDGTNTLTPEEAREAARRWLDRHQPGAVAGEADAFYGYYTVHIERDGEIVGMLSVHGRSGDVWYHDWHGDLVGMIGHEETDDHTDGA